eukprot:Partr_v1_DN44958_c0_g1_i1_m47222 putative Acyl-CoA dehydrogenase, C-terminal domain
MPFCHEWDESKLIPRSLLTKLAAENLLAAVIGAPIPADLVPGDRLVLKVTKASEFDYFHWLILYDELSRCGSGGVLWNLSGGLAIGLPPVVHFGSAEMKRRVVPPCLD